MAKATANCACATCGQAFERIMYGANRNDADRKAEWASGHFTECPECEAERVKRERDEANAAAAKNAEEAGFPALSGTEKQIVWANTLREKTLARIREICKPDGDPEHQANFERFLAWVIGTHDAASWWIDNRNMGAHDIDALVKAWAEAERNAPAPEPETPEEAALREDAEAEMTVSPANPAHGGAAEIAVTETAVLARYDRDEDFRAIVKGLGYRWDADRRAWAKAINETTGAASERAAELGNKLLNVGFAVRIADAATRTAAINADYAPEHMRWITLYTGDGPHKGWLCVRLIRGDDLYDAAKKIKGAQYVKPNVAVPVKRWAEALDFADCYDYRISADAQAAIDAERASIVTVAPAAAKVKEYGERRPEDILTTAPGVLEDLTDDD